MLLGTGGLQPNFCDARRETAACYQPYNSSSYSPGSTSTQLQTPALLLELSTDTNPTISDVTVKGTGRCDVL